MPLEDEVKYETLVETAPDAIFLVDMTTGEILEVNSRVAELLGYAQADLRGQPIQRVHPDEDTERYLRKFQEAVDRGSIQFSKFDDGTQVYLESKDGSRIPVDICATVVEGAHGPVLFGIARDITDITEYETEIEKLAGELAVVNRLIRHDIRNDMSVILGWLQQLRSELDTAHHDTLDMLIEQSESVVELTDTVKDYVEMLEDDANPQLEPVMIDETIEREAVATRQAYEPVDLSLGDIPNQPVLANSMLASVFRNLFHNAVQHNDKAMPVVEVTGEDREDTVVIHVSDNGPGIRDDQKADIFGKGTQGLESSGTGIGLFLIGELIETFDGDVMVSDNDPDGTTFSVVLRKP